MNETVTGSTLEEIKARYGKVYQVKATVAPDDETEIEMDYIFKKPTTASFERYLKTAGTAGIKALKALLFDNIVDEQREKLTEDLEEYPALALSVGEKLLAMLGLTKSTNLTKL